jgi:hypothetical protein
LVIGSNCRSNLEKWECDHFTNRQMFPSNINSLLFFGVIASQVSVNSELCKAGMLPESHSGDRNHGDVCRRQDNNGFDCPTGCNTSTNAPFCFKAIGKINHPCRLLTISSSPCQFSYKLEMHSTTPNHGDICRSHDKTTFVCPNTCARIQGEPFCTGGEMDGFPMPCRVHFNASRMTSVSIAASKVPERQTSTVVCDESEDPARVQGALLVRYTLEDTHGDICRPKSDVGGSFFCPKGCLHVTSPPYCTTVETLEEEEVNIPCRVPLETISRLDRLTARVQQLMDNKNRLIQMGDEQGASRADLSLRLVKHDLKKEKQSIAMAKKNATPL